MIDERCAQTIHGGVGELRRMLQIVRGNGEKMFGQQFGIVPFPGQDRPKLLPATQAIYRRRATFRAGGQWFHRRSIHDSTAKTEFFSKTAQAYRSDSAPKNSVFSLFAVESSMIWQNRQEELRRKDNCPPSVKIADSFVQ
jgi:hypothetical protein